MAGCRDHGEDRADGCYPATASIGGSIMIVRRLAILALACAAATAVRSEAWAQEMRVVETGPAANATIQSRAMGFYVRFDKPVDHIRSTLIIRRGGEVVQTLHPRLKAAPEVLFANVQALEPGDYTFGWTVNALNGTDVTQGQISFSVVAGKTTKE
jgi:methionine-rich copper-binding protein CopC